ncbi:hypothetical protein F0562_001274 [Nyssa sinensis]|uniref:RING-type E3 ubiquitin transferase n=1 Tax=Nyssa sinensis TaxID=561372 RepID=A0A5J5C346_9ASTE|nr:hypothetical protein F0562_001274 [Nyssa sinensis]
MPLSPASPPTSEALHWNPLVIASMGAVCTIFLLFSYYSILKLHNCSFLGMTLSRHRQQRQLLNGNSPDNPSLPFQSRGLGSYILQSLPIAQFKKNEEELRQSNTDCAVCLGEFEESEWLKHLPNCSHAFHVSCIDAWFQNHSNCPLCRSHVYDLAMQHEYSVSIRSCLQVQPHLQPANLYIGIRWSLPWWVLFAQSSSCSVTTGILKLPDCSFLGMTFSRNRQQRRLLNDNSPDDPSLRFQSRGLHSYILQSLPITQFKKNEEELRQSNTDCAVCLGEFEESEWLKHLPNCSHAFHVSCIDAWFQNNSNCPLCRSHVYDLAMQHEYSVSTYTLLETMRED